MNDEEEYPRGESRKKAVIAAAQRILGEASEMNVEQVHQITLRDVDAYAEDNVQCVTLIPLGGVIGVAIHRQDEVVKDADIVFVSASALGNTLPALGFTARMPAALIVPPRSAERATRTVPHTVGETS